VKAAAQAAGIGVAHPVIYGNAVRVLKLETAREAQPAEGPAAPRPKRRRRGSAARGLGDLAGLVQQMEAVVEERDRLRRAVDDSVGSQMLKPSGR
jgi:hypothetical protein